MVCGKPEGFEYWFIFTTILEARSLRSRCQYGWLRASFSFRVCTWFLLSVCLCPNSLQCHCSLIAPLKTLSQTQSHSGVLMVRICGLGTIQPQTWNMVWGTLLWDESWGLVNLFATHVGIVTFSLRLQEKEVWLKYPLKWMLSVFR